VRKGGNQVRITAQLIDAATGAHLWADRFDGLLEDVFELQDKVALSVAGVIEPTLQAAEFRRSAARATNDLTAYDLYLRAVGPIRSGERDKERYLEGLDLLGKAIERDPRYGPALACAAFCHQVSTGSAGLVSQTRTASKLSILHIVHSQLAVTTRRSSAKLPEYSATSVKTFPLRSH